MKDESLRSTSAPLDRTSAGPEPSEGQTEECVDLFVEAASEVERNAPYFLSEGFQGKVRFPQLQTSCCHSRDAVHVCSHADRLLLDGNIQTLLSAASSLQR